MKRALQALGRLKTGQMNKTEAAYAGHLRDLELAGEVLWWRFEGLKLRLADNTFLTPDFVVMRRDGRLELHDTKGARAIYTDDARVKMKVAAEMFPFVFRVCFPVKGARLGSWEIEEVGRGA